MLCSNVHALGQEVTHWRSNAHLGEELFEYELYPGAQHNYDRSHEVEFDRSESQIQRADFRSVVSALELLNPDAEVKALEFERNYPESGLAVELRLRAADHFFKLRRYEKARKWFEGVDRRLIGGSEKEEIDFKIAYTHFMSGDKATARPLFEKVGLGNSNYASSSRYYTAYIDYTDSNYEKAGAAFEKMKDDPQFGPVMPYYLTQIYYKTGRYDEVINTGQMLLERPDAVRAEEIERLVADAYYRKSNYKDAAIHLERFLEKGGKPSEQDRFQLGYSYYKTARYGEAKEHFNKIASGSGSLAQQAWYHLGDCYLKGGQKTEALNAFKASAALDLSPELQKQSAYLAAKLSYELPDPIDDPVKTIRAYLDRYPAPSTDRELNGLLADLYLNRRDYLQAMAALEKTGNDSPELKAAYQQVAYYRGVELFNALEFEQAISTFEKSQQRPAKSLLSALAHYWIAEALFKLNRLSESVVQYERFLAHPGASSSSEYKRARYDLAYARFKLKEYAAASVEFRGFADRGSSDLQLKGDARLRAGDCHFMSGEYTAAANQYKLAVESKVKDADYALLQWANCLGLTGKTEDKIRTLHRLSTEFPQSRFAAEALYERGSSYLTADRPQEALAAFEQFEKAYPAHPLLRSARLNQAVALRNIGQSDRALDVSKKLVTDHPNTQEAREAVSLVRRIYSDRGEVDAYVSWVEKLKFADLEESGLDSTLYYGAYDRYASSDDASALRQFDAYRSRFPEGLFIRKALLYSAEIRERQGLAQEAAKDRERLFELGPGEFYDRVSYDLGVQAQKAGKKTEAQTYFEALRGTSNFALIRDSRIFVLRMEAEDSPETALILAGEIVQDERSKPEDRTEARLVRARTYERVGKWAEAAADYRLLYADPKGESAAEAGIALARMDLNNGEPAKAVEQVYETLKRQPNYPRWKDEGFLVLIDAFIELNDAFQAEYLIDHLEKNADDPKIIERAREARSRLSAKNAPQPELKTGETEELMDDAGEDEVEFEEETDEP